LDRFNQKKKKKEVRGPDRAQAGEARLGEYGQLKSNIGGAKTFQPIDQLETENRGSKEVITKTGGGEGVVKSMFSNGEARFRTQGMCNFPKCSGSRRVHHKRNVADFNNNRKRKGVMPG